MGHTRSIQHKAGNKIVSETQLVKFPINSPPPESTMKLNKIAVILALGAADPLHTNADTIKFQVPACTTEDLLKEFSGYIYDNDTQGMLQLINNGYCIVLKEGDQVSRIKYGFMRSAIRINGIKYYLASEALSDEPTPRKIEQYKSQPQKTPPQTREGKPQSKPRPQQQPKPETLPPAGSFTVQTPSVASESEALNIQAQLTTLGYKPRIRAIQTSNKTTYRVFTEFFQEKEQAIAAKKRIDETLKLNSLVLPVKS